MRQIPTRRHRAPSFQTIASKAATRMFLVLEAHFHLCPWSPSHLVPAQRHSSMRRAQTFLPLRSQLPSMDTSTSISCTLLYRLVDSRLYVCRGNVLLQCLCVFRMYRDHLWWRCFHIPISDGANGSLFGPCRSLATCLHLLIPRGASTTTATCIDTSTSTHRTSSPTSHL